MSSDGSFSNRHGYSPEITIWDGDPGIAFRGWLVHALSVRPCDFQALYRRVRLIDGDPPRDPRLPAIGALSLVEEFVHGSEWYHLYDFVEFVYELLNRQDPFGGFTGHGEELREALNRQFVRRGIGWQMTDEGKIAVRGSDSFESATFQTLALLEERVTAHRELRAAVLDLSRRPEPDLEGAIRHAIASLECLARDLVGEPKAMLGPILKRHPNLLPKPLDTAFEKIWAYANDQHRHVVEGSAANLNEAILTVHLVTGCVEFLAKQARVNGEAGGGVDRGEGAATL